ncbi:hypothetical protein ACRBEV_03180 [Methylobacterium phyllosphaerae]
MGKPRRPRGSRSTWAPKPPQDADTPAPDETQIAESPLPAAPVTVAADEPVPGVDVASDAPQLEPAPESIEAAAAPAAEDAPGTDLVPAPVPVAASAAVLNNGAFVPGRIDVVAIGSTIARYVRGEGEAAFAHLRALSGARSPADLIRLQVGEAQRAADASLTCWVTVIGQASRSVAFR